MDVEHRGLSLKLATVRTYEFATETGHEGQFYEDMGCIPGTGRSCGVQDYVMWTGWFR